MPSSSGAIRACVGIHVHAEPQRLQATLAAVERWSPGVEVLILGDGADHATAAALEDLGRIGQSSTARPKGVAACFNRLAAGTDAEVIVLLESGATVGPEWLDRLLIALAADPRNGLAGPSTNRSWNEQQVAAPGDDVVRAARAVVGRFGSRVRTLEPLHSLADFCYAVKRDVLDIVGAADERYGTGPCWEMDYNVRAARAGFRGLWVCGAYVHRSPFTARRRRTEEERFESSRRLYQDNFCALRLRGERTDYEAHCRGDACEHFAPRELIEIARPLRRRRRPPRPAPTTPLVTCIMPTGSRPDFALQAVEYFLRQDYPAKELVIVDDGDGELARRLPEDARIRHVRVSRGMTIGAKRNLACESASGELIAQWDDDDWYGPQRLTAQIEPLRTGRADVTGLICSSVLDVGARRFWGLSRALHKRLFVGDVHGGTLVYRRQVWDRMARYPDRSLAEDAWFLAYATRRGARLARLPGDPHFVYVRHGQNAWRFATGSYLGSDGWLVIPEPELPAEDLRFYASRSVERETPGRSPLVTCIMPTANRRHFVPRSIEYFLRQDYASRELLVLDDGEDPVTDLIPADPRVRYVRLDDRLVLGEKRNRACELARGEIIVHWDDDDWQAPWRLSYQVRELFASDADVIGTSRVLYVDVSGERSWLYVYPPGHRRWLAGGSFCYRRSLWERRRFPPLQSGEDARFIWSREASKSVVLDDYRFMVGLVHPDNTSRKDTASSCWHARSVDEVRRLLGDDFELHVGHQGPGDAH